MIHTRPGPRRCTSQRFLAMVLTVFLLASTMLSTGCATLINGSSKNVTFVVTPQDRVVHYEGRAIGDGEVVTVRKSLSSANKVNVGSRERPNEVDLRRDFDPWFIGSVAFLILGIIPGVVAMGVDLMTGAVMEPSNTQNFHVMDP